MRALTARRAGPSRYCLAMEQIVSRTAVDCDRPPALVVRPFQVGGWCRGSGRLPYPKGCGHGIRQLCGHRDGLGLLGVRKRCRLPPGHGLASTPSIFELLRANRAERSGWSPRREAPHRAASRCRTGAGSPGRVAPGKPARPRPARGRRRRRPFLLATPSSTKRCRGFRFSRAPRRTLATR